MNINSLNGVNAYSNIPASTPPVDNSQLQEQNREASRSELDYQARTKQAFEVSITEEARQRLAAQNAENSRQARSEEIDSKDRNTIVPSQNASQIVNIVA